jgi:hypothetical protein
MVLFVLAATLLLVNVEVKRIILNLVINLSIGSGATEIGWPIFWNPFEFLGFMSGLKSGFSGQNTIGILKYLQAVFITVSISAVIFYGFSDFNKSKYKTFLIIPIGLIFASAVVFIKMRYFTEGLLPNEQGATFLQLKTAKYASPFLIIILFSSLIFLSFKNKLIKKYLPYILVVYLIASIGHNYVAMKNVHGDFVDKIGSRNSFEEILNLKHYLDDNLDSTNVEPNPEDSTQDDTVLENQRKDLESDINQAQHELTNNIVEAQNAQKERYKKLGRISEILLELRKDENKYVKGGGLNPVNVKNGDIFRNTLNDELIQIEVVGTNSNEKQYILKLLSFYWFNSKFLNPRISWKSFNIEIIIF